MHVPLDAEPTQPYWLSRRVGEQARSGDAYDWRKDDPQTEPFAPSLVSGEVEMSVGASSQVVSVPIEYRYLDAVRGEVHLQVLVAQQLG